MKYLVNLDLWSFYSAYLPAVIGLILFKNTGKTLRILSVFLVINVLIETAAFLIGDQGINNMFVFHIYTPVEFSFVIWIAMNIMRPVGARIWTVIGSSLFMIFCFFDAFYIESIYFINFLPRGIEGLSAIGICIYFFYQLFNADETLDLIHYPYFWLFSGWLIYFSGTFFLFIYNNQAGFNITFPVIHSVLNILLNLVYTYTLWLGSRKLISQ